MELSSEQQKAKDAVASGKSVMITGNGGTGKSVLLNDLRKHFRMAVTASTGIAALNVGGSTIHSFTGLGIGTVPVDKIVANLRKRERDYNDRKLSMLQNLLALSIDEISMLEARYFGLVDELFRAVRENDLPFGGVQLIMLGDFLQLPPINKVGVPKFVFESPVWEQLDPEVHMLRKTFRQADQEFADILNEIRMGRLSDSGRALIEERYHAVDDDSEHPCVVLNTHNDGCDQYNSKELKKLLQNHPPSIYTARDTFKHDSFAEQLDKNCLAPRVLTLCPGARVMLLKNLDPFNGLANGSVGTVTKSFNGEVHVLFDNGHEHKIEEASWEVLNGEEVLATRTQIPLRLAWAVTVHKSQGMSLDKVEAHLDQCFAQGQAYVALSRAKRREGLFIRGGTKINITANPRAVQFYREYAA